MLVNILSLITHLSSLLAMAATAYFFRACTLKEKHECSPRPSRKEDQDGWKLWNATRQQLESKRIKTFFIIMACYLVAMSCIGPLIALTRNLVLADTELMVLLIATAFIPVVAVLRTARHDSVVSALSYEHEMSKNDGH